MIRFPVLDRLQLQIADDPIVVAGTVTLENLIRNTNGELGGWGWLSPVPSTAVRGDDGSTLTLLTAVAQAAYYTSGFLAVGGASHVRAQLRNHVFTAAGLTVRARLVFYDADYQLISSSAQTVATGPNTFANTGGVATPAGTEHVKLRIDTYRAGGNPAAGDRHHVDQVVVVAGTLAQVTDPNIQLATGWLDVAGSLVQVSTDRAELDLGILDATLKSSSLDPAQTGAIRAGKAIRLLVNHDTLGAQPLFVGEVSRAETTYDLANPDPEKRAIIKLSAVDHMARLAALEQPDTVGTTDELAHTLEPAGLPWNVNNDTGQKTTPAVIVSRNDNANIADQLALTRDSNLAAAWISRAGIVNVYDAAILGTRPAGAAPGVLDEAAYGIDVAIDFATDRAINYLTVKLQRINPETGEAEEVPFGPFTDEASRREWGTLSAEFTVAGLDETSIPTYAAAILASNAVPQRRPVSASIPIRTTDELDWTLLDLYDDLTVRNTAGAVDELLRPVRITHRITARAWTVEVAFDTDAGVAIPQAIPPPAFDTAATLAELLRPVGEVTMFYGTAAQIPTGWLELNGATFDGAAWPKLLAHLGTNLLPDWNDRYVVGASAAKPVGSAGGAASVNLPDHKHPGAAHTHNAGTLTASGNPDDLGGRGAGTTNTPSTIHHHNVTGTTAGASVGNTGDPTTSPAIDTMSPYRALRLIIRAA